MAVQQSRELMQLLRLTNPVQKPALFTAFKGGLMLKNKAQIGQALPSIMARIEIIANDPIQHKPITTACI
jgi:hypothetical protein